ncbi:MULTISPECIES: NAD-dependent epimerase/dehydratase family protein [Bacillus]|uniref:Diaminohydroxyphosphoribosylaminopyrimidine deaminase n=2 Tax=Bacillus TaxID=1386 RepID=A0A0M4FLK7_9BACI|nr:MULTISPECIES: NAD-dependent epimerase/dehydratase family protein [Bacillus]ALC82954.1 diaminohydroxyphosphoribosylaminopyrimidine deaminase [Bacillus gobiensis]MBP1081949.1 nucleoside-diphosphate-sugar epimerase [Bacillus capparidis]MED1096593.1 NAD-dependent epimerase/dehydratase family protein [Bacillus capparidis]
MKKTTVLVTGGTGYLASWIVKDLLKEGHDVRITVRDKGKEEKYEHLRQIEKETPGNLFIYEADLLKKGSFDLAVEGTEFVFHTASPFYLSGIKDAYNELVKPAKEGTRNVLLSVNKADSVKRVILTSSVAAVHGDNRDMNGKQEFTEKDWNESSSVEHQPYNYSKTVAEKEAWSIQKEQNNWDLVTINPSFILGPSLTKRADSTSISTILDLLKGTYKTGVPKLFFGMVDVRDTAKAHILAAFTENASGRYIISGKEASVFDMAKILEGKFPDQYALPKREVPKPLMWLIAPTLGFTRKYVSTNVGHSLKLNNSKSIKDLGMNYRSLEATLIDQKNQLDEAGLI